MVISKTFDLANNIANDSFKLKERSKFYDAFNAHVFRVDVDNESISEIDIEEKAESIKHIISINTINVHEEVFYHLENPQRINHEIGSNTINGCVTVILDRIAEIEKFWAYLPLEVVRSVEIIRENCGLKECLSPINSSVGIIQGILQKSENHILQNKYQILKTIVYFAFFR